MALGQEQTPSSVDVSPVVCRFLPASPATWSTTTRRSSEAAPAAARGSPSCRPADSATAAPHSTGTDGKPSRVIFIYVFCSRTFCRGCRCQWAMRIGFVERVRCDADSYFSNCFLHFQFRSRRRQSARHGFNVCGVATTAATEVANPFRPGAGRKVDKLLASNLDGLKGVRKLR